MEISGYFPWAVVETHKLNDSFFRAVYIKTVSPQPKFVVIIMDHGMSLSQNQLTTAKAVSKQLLASLSEDDRVSFFGLSSTISHPREDACLNQQLCVLTPESRIYLNKFIDDISKEKSQLPLPSNAFTQTLTLHSDGSCIIWIVPATTNHSLGFDEAFRVIANTLKANNKSAQNGEILLQCSKCASFLMGRFLLDRESADCLHQSRASVFPCGGQSCFGDHLCWEWCPWKQHHHQLLHSHWW